MVLRSAINKVRIESWLKEEGRHEGGFLIHKRWRVDSQASITMEAHRRA